jgi:hypothetical protein
MKHPLFEQEQTRRVTIRFRMLQRAQKITYNVSQTCQKSLLTNIDVLASPNSRGVRMKGWSLILGLILSSCALAQEASPVLGGSWTATAGANQIFRGTWSGQASLHNPNAARGSWTLFNDASEILLEGTWSAQKTAQGWQGTWTARSEKGQLFSGTWAADVANLNPETFAEMLKRTATREVAGSWRSGRHQGNWWLKGSPQQSHR